MNGPKITVIGGASGTAALIRSLLEAHSLLGLQEVALYGSERPAQAGEHGAVRITTPETIEEAVDGARFVIHAASPASTDADLPGPAALLMALRAVPLALEHARIVERLTPGAYWINLTHPVGIVTQAVLTHTSLRAIGVCEAPGELLRRVARALGSAPEELDFVYSGLNHAGWLQRVLRRGDNLMPLLFNQPDRLQKLYPEGAFDVEILRLLQLLPCQHLNSHYARTEGPGKAGANPLLCPATHACSTLDVLIALTGGGPRRVVVNTRNHGAIEDIEPGEVVEVPCWIDADGPEPIRMGALPQAGRGLVLAMKAYERLVIRAAVRGSLELAKLALMVCPFTETAPVSDILEAAVERDPLQLGYLRPASFATAGD